MARFTEKRIEKLLLNPGIVRNRLKVTAAVSNARKFLEVQAEFGTFDAYIWGFVGGRPQGQPLATHEPAPGDEQGIRLR